MLEKTTKVSVAEMARLAFDACLVCGASTATAQSLVDATVSATHSGRPALGFPHLVGYLDALRAGRINGQAKPRFHHALPALIHVDADGGMAQLGFDLICEDLTKRTRTFGVTVFTQKGSYMTGELGYYVRRLAMDGLMSVAVTNGPALMAPDAGGERVYCTNPLAFGAPLPKPLPPLVIDQASSATAFVNIKQPAEAGSSIPPGWAIDETGEITTDPARAVLGGYR